MATATEPSGDLERALCALAAEIHHRNRGQLRELCLTVAHGHVLLRGIATCYTGKQIALAEARRWCPLPVAANLIEVEEVAPDILSRSNTVGG